MRLRLAAALLGAVWSACGAEPRTVLVMEFQNKSPYGDLSWVGESIADRLMTEFATSMEIVPTRAERSEGERRLALRPGADYTKATMVRLGQTLNADTVCFGSFSIVLPTPDTPLKSSSIRITAQFLDLRKLHFGPEISEAGALSELSRLEEHLAYEALRDLQPDATFKLEQFVTPQKTVRLEAEESYTRGLLSGDREQRQKWFLQAIAVDNKFVGPAYELGKIALEQKQYPEALNWLRRVGPADPNFADARFRMGLAAYNNGDYSSAIGYNREVLDSYPLSEVYNNLGAAEAQNDVNAGAADLRRAVESDPQNATYLFNLGLVLCKVGQFDEAGRTLQQMLSHSDDMEARTLADRARRRQLFTGTDKPPALRLKNSFSATAFRQLKAVLQTKSPAP